MNLLDRFRYWLAGGVKAANQLSFMPNWVRYTVFQPTYTTLVREGYKANSAVLACAATLAFAFPEPPLLAWRRGRSGLEPQPDHPLSRLLAVPNPDMSPVEFHMLAIAYASIGGNVYLWKQRNRVGQPVALWPFNDAQMTPIPGTTTREGWVREYELDIGTGPVIVPKRDIIHWKWLPDLEQPWLGMGAVASAARDVGTDNEAADYVYSLLRNSAVPPGVVTLVEGEEIDDVRIERMRAQWADRYGGANRGTPAFLEAGMAYQAIGQNLEQLAFEALRNTPESRIAAAFRVPPIVAGLNLGLQRSTFSNYGEARRAFAEDTLAPLWTSFASELQAGLVDDFGGGLELHHDLAEVRALQEDRNALWERVARAWENGLVTRRDARQQLGLEAGPADEVYRMSMTVELWPADQLVAPALPAPDTAPPADDQPDGAEEEPDDADEDDEGPEEAGLFDRFPKASKADGDRVMVTLLPPPALTNILQEAQDDLPDNTVRVNMLHLTLAYLGAGLDARSVAQVTATVADVASRFGPLAVTLNGTGRFNQPDDEGRTPFYASLDSPDLPALRQALVDTLLAAGLPVALNHGFVPHVTLGYIPADTPAPELDLPRLTFIVSQLHVAVENNLIAVPLVASRGAKEARLGLSKAAEDRRRALVDARVRARRSVAGRAQAAIDAYFEDLADRVVGRARDAAKAATARVAKALPDEGDLLNDRDAEQLAGILRRYYVEVLVASWEGWNLELGEEIRFDENDPLVTELLGDAGKRIRDITDTTRGALRDLLRYGNEAGWSIEDLVAGDEERDGIRKLVSETYRGRAQTIARTELGNAQNRATVGRYARAGVPSVKIYDNGFENSHPTCKWIDGQIRPLAWTESDHPGEGPKGVRNPLQHPRCVRAFGAVFT